MTNQNPSIAELEAQLSKAKQTEAEALSIDASKFIALLIEKFGRVHTGTKGASLGRTFVNLDANKVKLAVVEGYSIGTSKYGLMIEKI